MGTLTFAAFFTILCSYINYALLSKGGQRLSNKGAPFFMMFLFVYGIGWTVGSV